MNENKELDCHKFQTKVNDLLIRHRSILDILTKYQESNSRVNRSVAKTVTNCGCLEVTATKKEIPQEARLDELKNYTETHVEGGLCDNCREIVEMELGNNLFYVAALCNILGLDLQEVLEQEYKKIATLGRFNLS
ncbi:DUF1573 domain-containing protein [Proteinivorax hydrogeniformans]|uniref:DUF1573 domain-containing protein n=1 Tax=Proteinivorax hydrogeniformans TaxID=1826727 RepID=A0AAU8HTZ5_9FIRM